MSLYREYIQKPIVDVITGKRSKHWRKTRKAFLKSEGNGECAACGTKKKLQVHHIEDFSTNPTLELEHSNLITLCQRGTSHHLNCGHIGNWKSINPHVRRDAAYVRERIENRR